MANSVTLIGHTGDDIKLHYFEGGNCIGRLSLATNSSYVNKSTGEKITKTQWHNLVFRNKAAELIEKYVPKGNKLYVQGRLEYREWTDENNQKRYMTEIHVLDFEFLSSKSEPENQGGRSTTERQQQNQSAPTNDYSNFREEDHDDLPF